MPYQVYLVDREKVRQNILQGSRRNDLVIYFIVETYNVKLITLNKTFHGGSLKTNEVACFFLIRVVTKDNNFIRKVFRILNQENVI